MPTATIALAISPWTQRGRVDSTHYSTSSRIVTTEDLLGLAPMSVHDARVSRMWRSFSNRPIMPRYEARVPEVVPFGNPAAPVNAPDAPMARESSAMDFSRGDDQPEVLLNEAIWKSVRGRDSRMPRPRHDRIIGSTPNDEAQKEEEEG